MDFKSGRCWGNPSRGSAICALGINSGLEEIFGTSGYILIIDQDREHGLVAIRSRIPSRREE